MSLFKQLNVFAFPAYLKRYLLIAYGFSYALWIAAWVLVADQTILVNHEIFAATGLNKVLWASLLASIATLGPFVGYLIVRNHIPEHLKKPISFAGFRNTVIIFSIFATIAVIVSAFGGLHFNPAMVGISIFAFFYFMATSATEEFGWRGVYQPFGFQNAKNLLQASFVTALIWGPWHTPIVLIIFTYQGLTLVEMIPMYLMFLGSIFLSSYHHGWVNLRAKGILPNVVLHGLQNWLPVALLLFFGDAMAMMAILAGYGATVVILQFAFPSDRFFSPKNKPPQ